MAEPSGKYSSRQQTYFRGLVRGWSKPGDVVALLMIINGDIVQKALAQLAGPRLVPVAFSFGWVVYSIQAFSSVIGTGRLMPTAPDLESIVINIDSGHQRANRSWILGRLLRDWDYKPLTEHGLYITVLDAIYQKDAMGAKLGSNEEGSERGQALPPRQSADGPESGNSLGTLCCLQPDPDNAGTTLTGDFDKVELNPSQRWFQRLLSNTLTPVQTMTHYIQTWTEAQWQEKGWVWMFAWVIIGAQMVVAAVPLKVDHDATTLVITLLGTGLALGCGALPRWREEKWCCRKNTNKKVCLLEGNGGQHVIVVLGNGVGWDLEDLAGGRVAKKAKTTTILTFVQTVLWMALLIIIARDEGQTWFLMIIGGLGILQNIVVAGAPRPASAFGFHLRQREVLYSPNVRHALCQAEEKIAGLGCCLRPIYFPGKATKEDDEAFAFAEQERIQQHRQVHPSSQEQATSTGREGGATDDTSLESRRKPLDVDSEAV
ncbi:MAG: hypothetical protein LQ338_007802 [Usnochroma carphineum]|nr:MAG: hypothetical protein LQ338_007802 [Usnochroma carphineum]